ncbi:MAG: type II 3-dehydroquinate dehydratase [Pseudomonadota bacterium]
MPSVLVLNGPNLNLLGRREPGIYGTDSLADVETRCTALGHAMGLQTVWRQSNHEGVLIDWIQEARGTAAAIVINPGGLSHTSVALLDALNAVEAPVIEVHISNIHRREAFRHHSFVSARADAVIAGCGVHGYALALRQVALLLGGAEAAG